jgi:hypothetical protein
MTLTLTLDRQELSDNFFQILIIFCNPMIFLNFKLKINLYENELRQSFSKNDVRKCHSRAEQTL